MPSSEASVWRRRERALGGGLVIWALAVSTTVALAPEATVDWILTTDPLVIVGTILITIGLCGGLVETILLLAERWAEASDPELTEAQWDE